MSAATGLSLLLLAIRRLRSSTMLLYSVIRFSTFTLASPEFEGNVWSDDFCCNSFSTNCAIALWLLSVSSVVWLFRACVIYMFEACCTSGSKFRLLYDEMLLSTCPKSASITAKRSLINCEVLSATRLRSCTHCSLYTVISVLRMSSAFLGDSSLILKSTTVDSFELSEMLSWLR